MYSFVGFLPISVVVLGAGTFAVSYIIAVIRGDVSAAFPYISDTGAEIPESSVFGQFLNLAAFLSFWTIFVRYKIVHALGSDEDRSLIRINKVALFFGVVSSLGCSMVANFQEGTDVEKVHITGAVLVFLGGLIYAFLQSAISYHMYPDFCGLYICRIRLSICLASLISMITTIVAAALASYKWNNEPHTGSRFKWDVNDPGYAAHLVSTIGEWVMALTFLSFFFTYVREFNKIELQISTRPLVRHMDEEPYMHEPRMHHEANEHTRLLA